MDTTNSSEKPQRRVEDRKPAEVIGWGAPGAPAVPQSIAHPIGQLSPTSIESRIGARPAATSGDAPADLQQLKALALAALQLPDTFQPYVSGRPQVVVATHSLDREQMDAVAGFYDAANPAVVLGLIARIGTLEDSFKLALGSLALKDCNVADRIGKQYRQQAVRIESAAAPAPSDWREIAAQACYGQRENRDALRMPEDVAYNQAIENCMDAIRNLPDGPASPATASGDELPELPSTNYNGYSDGREPLYTAAQMREYARAAVSALASPQD